MLTRGIRRYEMQKYEIRVAAAIILSTDQVKFHGPTLLCCKVVTTRHKGTSFSCRIDITLSYLLVLV